MATGAVVAGRGTFEPAGGWGGGHHDGVPIFVLDCAIQAGTFSGTMASISRVSAR